MKMPLKNKLTCYVCDEEECDLYPGEQLDVCEDALLCWKTMIRESDGAERGSRGCISSHDHAALFCSQNLRLGKSQVGGGQFQTECCQDDLCNGGPFPALEDLATDGIEINGAFKSTLLILAPILCLSLVILIVIWCLRRCRRQANQGNKKKKRCTVELGLESMATVLAPTSPGLDSCSNEIRATAAGDRSLKEYMEGQSMTSGSGSGLPMLVQSSLAKQISLEECLSRPGGCFGREVWRGIWQGESVAVKIFLSRDEPIWARETEVYSRYLQSRHDNILGYIGSDMASRPDCTQLWLVTHYHPLGSLHDYLLTLSKPMDYQQMFNLCLSIVDGLLYLHTEIQGTRGKPSMAHRNIKSKNILVKSNGACVIADLAHVVTQNELDTEKVNIKQGSIRYMSPELLDQTIDPQCLESFRRADIYSLGLVFWEICRRCTNSGDVLDYAAPFSEWLASSYEPSLEEMRKLVVTEQCRPPSLKPWNSDKTLTQMAGLMKECWYANSAARLPILRVKKRLIQLAAVHPEVNLPVD